MDIAQPASALPSNSDQAPTGSGISSPELNLKTGKPGQRAVKDAAQIFNIIGNLQQARRSQNEKNGRIQGKINAERPYDEKALENEGLGYKSNFSTKPLSTTVAKVSSRLTKAIQSARYLTSAELPDDIPDAKKKTEMFRNEVTNCIRKWDGWYNFVNEVASEDSTFGWATVAWLDTDSWRPVFFRQDRAFLPDGTRHNVDSTQFGAFLQYLMPHELANLVRGENGSAKDLELARDAGWNIAETMEAINNARPPSIPSAKSAPYTDFRRYEDSLRESSVTLSLVDGAKQVMLWHVFVTEINGKVSHYIGDGNSNKILFEKLDRFDKISDALAFLSYEQANGLLMGSKGIGREIYELSNIVDRARNETVDRLQMSGKLIITCPENKINRFKLTVVGNVVLIPEGCTLQQNKIETSISEFIQLDSLLTQLLDQIAGGVTPRTFDRERVTKTEVDLYASREEEKRDDIETRFVTQFGSIITTCQRRITAKGVSDEDAKATREKLLRYMSEDELQQLADQPALRTIEDYTQSDAQKIVMLAQESRNDPLYDHAKMERRKLSVLVDPEFADDVLLPENDPTQPAEQAREQLMENLLLAGGLPVPVSPRDNHMFHINVLKQALAPIAQHAASTNDPKVLQSAEMFVKHWAAHFNMLMETATDKKALAPMQKELEGVAKQVGELQAHAAAGIAPGSDANGQPAGADGSPPPDGAAPQGEPLASAPSPALAPAPVAPAA
jgi:hypothetical protein